MIPVEVERLQTQLTRGELEVEEFFGLIVAMFEFADAKQYLKTVLHNIRIIASETVWGDRYRTVYDDLVVTYQEFYCEEVDHQENIERYDWREGLENSRNSFDDIIENQDDKKFLDNGDVFLDDGACLAEDAALAFNLSLDEVVVKSASENSHPISKNPGKSRRKKKKKAEKEGPVILWLRRDLRIHDNPALITACDLSRPVIPVFIWSEREEAAGGATKVWLEQALASLKTCLLSKYEHDLVLRCSDSCEEGLVSLVEETGARDVVWTALYEPHLAHRDAGIKTALARLGVRVHIEHSYLLHRPEQVSVAGVGARGIGSVTHFMECCKQNPGDKIGYPVDPPKWITKPAVSPGSCKIADLGLYRKPRRRDGSNVDWAKTIRENWVFGEDGGYANLRRFLDENVEKYEAESARADEAWTAVISPYLHWGELSPRLVLHEAFVGKIAAKFRRKLAWRDLSYWLLSIFPSMDREPIRPPYRHQAWSTDQSLLLRWQRGLTGFPLVDAAMRQLWAVGWINNYMRHVVASFLLSYLRISWVEGYSWFQDTLVDADMAINAMMWQNGGFSGLDQWNFVMHPVDAAATCDPRGDYVRQWVPELAGLPDKFIHQPWKCTPVILKRSGVLLGENYPNRCIISLEEEREKSLADVVEVRRKHGKGYIDPEHGRDMAPIPCRLLGSARDVKMIPLITRKEFIYKTGQPGSEGNPYNPVLKGYVTRERDEEVRRTNKVNITASTMLEFTARKQRLDKMNGVEEERPRGSFGGRGKGNSNLGAQRRTKAHDQFTKV
jgi:deoxyribodipyrimidine photolyase